jgi:hypothetical protein
MTSSALKVSLCLLLAFTLFAIFPRLSSQAEPPNLALRGFTAGCLDKPKPCWYGIVPNITTREETVAILTGLGYRLAIDHNAVGPQLIETVASPEGFGCAASVKIRPRPRGRSSQPLPLVDEFTLRDCRNLTLGDLVFVGNNPVLAYNCAVGVRVALGGGIWLNMASSAAPPYEATDPVRDLVLSFNSPYLIGWHFVPQWYGLLPEADLRSLVLGMYCQQP